MGAHHLCIKSHLWLSNHRYQRLYISLLFVTGIAFQGSKHYPKYNNWDKFTKSNTQDCFLPVNLKEVTLRHRSLMWNSKRSAQPYHWIFHALQQALMLFCYGQSSRVNLLIDCFPISCLKDEQSFSCVAHPAKVRADRSQMWDFSLARKDL